MILHCFQNLTMKIQFPSFQTAIFNYKIDHSASFMFFLPRGVGIIGDRISVSRDESIVSRDKYVKNVYPCFLLPASLSNVIIAHLLADSDF